MKYYLGKQVVPGKGYAQMMYEVSDEGEVKRTLTWIEETAELERVPDPIVKFLYKPERLEEIEEARFKDTWAKGD